MWAGTCTVRLDNGLHLGVRADTDESARLIRRFLAPVVADEVDAPVNYSVRLAEASERGIAGLGILYRHITKVVRSRDRRRVLRALANFLALHRDDDGSLLRVRAAAVVVDGRAVLAPLAVRGQLPRIERRLNAKGMQLLDQRFVMLDPASCELVVPAPALDVDWSVVDELAPATPRDADEPPPPGRYQVARWIFPSTADEPPTRGAVVHQLASAVDNLAAVGGRRTLEALERAVRDVRVFRPDNHDDWLTALAG